MLSGIPGLCSKSGKSSSWKRSIELTFEGAVAPIFLGPCLWTQKVRCLSERQSRLLETEECRLIKHLQCQPDVRIKAARMWFPAGSVSNGAKRMHAEEKMEQLCRY